MKKPAENICLKSSLVHNPFTRLKGLVERVHSSSSTDLRKETIKEKETVSKYLSEEELFKEAMSGVDPLVKNHAAGKNVAIKQIEKFSSANEDETLSQLSNLVNHGEGFIVSDTPEYIEGTGYNSHREFARRLHRGDFSIQAHIDLHGMNVEQAKEAFESFLGDAINSGKRTVLIIHGRGLSSRGEPVLKNKVREWLNQSYWLKRVIAYTSAQSYDGGAGATYVLLRSRPATKKSVK
ncbi:MAG: DNA mismatch repair protein MutS [Syntrophaceae bacterium]|nr:DNA mismatch repair protein MutS [Syntrophaceae bacterium]